MTDDGKRFDVLIEPCVGVDPRTGVSKHAGWKVWADKGYKDIILSVPGVRSFVLDCGTAYYIEIDPRYDEETVLANIEAAIKINPPDSD